ncbi:MAG TPA: DMT family transporter [Candidatus Sulfotelmatobacter sp.]|nr:DMT family transporter [Candidatus Sulfotelmatobacter sp.]
MTARLRQTGPTDGAGRLWHAPRLLLAAASLFWAGNFIVGRAVHGTVPPFGLAFWRWTGSLVLVLGFAWPHLRRDAAVLRRHWPVLLLLSGLGVSAYSALTYLGLQSTTAINALLLQSAMPLVILVWCFALFGERARPLQLAGIVVSLAGVAVIVTRGTPQLLLAFALGPGDPWVLVAVLSYALYSTLLRKRPPVHPLSFLAASFAFGAALLLPLYLWEHLSGAPTRPSAAGLLAIGYLALFPSCLAYMFYNRGVELIGPTRAGQFFHLMPVFGTVLAVLLLGEPFEWFQGLGFVLIAAGIGLTGLRA